MHEFAVTAMQSGLISCHVCHLLAPAAAGAKHCARCGAHLHVRKTNSIRRSWAYLIAAYIMYLPANFLPVMTVMQLGVGNPDTIFSGVVALAASGMWPLALLVFFASFMVPLLKLLGMSYVLISVQRRSCWNPRARTVLYRIIEAVGRWSMLDIFMISILIALVKLGSIATIDPGAGATSFAAVVLLTMFASMTFDPRLIWDACEKQ